MGCGKSKPQDVAIGRSLSKSRTAKSIKTSLSHHNNNNNATAAAAADDYVNTTSPTVNVASVEKSPVVVVVSDTKLEESPPAYSAVPETTKPEESPLYTVVLDTKSEESPVFTLISDENNLEQSPPVAETTHMVTEESPVYTVVSDTNSEDSPGYTLVSDTKPEEESIVSDSKPEETFLMSNWVDDAMDIVPETEKPPTTETEEDANFINSHNNLVVTPPANESSPARDLIMTSEPTPKESRIADDEDVKEDEEEEIASEFDDAQTTILPIHEEVEENNIVKAYEKETTEEIGMKSEDSFDKEDHKEIKEKRVTIAEEAN